MDAESRASVGADFGVGSDTGSELLLADKLFDEAKGALLVAGRQAIDLSLIFKVSASLEAKLAEKAVDVVSRLAVLELQLASLRASLGGGSEYGAVKTLRLVIQFEMALVKRARVVVARDNGQRNTTGVATVAVPEGSLCLLVALEQTKLPVQDLVDEVTLAAVATANADVRWVGGAHGGRRRRRTGGRGRRTGGSARPVGGQDRWRLTLGAIASLLAARVG